MLGPLLLLLAGFELSVQEPGATFPFARNELQIEVTARTAVRIDIADGREGRVTIDDLTQPPAAAYAIAGTSLAVSHQSPAAGRYRIKVPPNAQVALRVNASLVGLLPASATGRRLVWFSGAPHADEAEVDAAKRPRHEREGPERAAAHEPALPFRIDAFRGPLVVDSIDVANPERARILRIRLGRSDFRVMADRAVGFGFHEPTRWGVLTIRDTAARVDVEIPAGASRFTLRVAGRRVWTLNSAGARALCQPFSRVTRRDGGEDWVFHLEGGLICREEPETRPA